jgi:hypothetical protein
VCVCVCVKCYDELFMMSVQMEISVGK